MKVTYDKEADAAYIYMKDKIGKGEVKSTISMNENALAGRCPQTPSFRFLLDFDANKKLIGIEILCASTVVPKGVVGTFQVA